MNEFKSLEEIVKQPDDAVFIDFDFDKANAKRKEAGDIFASLDAVSDSQLKGKFYFTIGDLKEIAKKFENDKIIIELFAAQKTGNRNLDENKPEKYETSAEVRNEYDAEYFEYRKPIIDHILLKCNFDVNPTDFEVYGIYAMVADAVIQIIRDENPKWI